MSEDGTLLLALAVGYLLGSIPFGLILTKVAGFGDIRRIGSGNIGATNVLRTGSKKLALAVLFLDSAKGALAVALTFGLGPAFYLTAGTAAVFGHLFPIWLRRDRRALVTLAVLTLDLALMLTQHSSMVLQLLGTLVLLALATQAWGGKGVATAIGVLLAAAWPVGLLTAATWLVVALLLRRSSVAALSAMVAAPVYATLLTDAEHTAFTLFLALVVILRHMDNIRRLWRGEEPRINLDGSAKAGDAR